MNSPNTRMQSDEQTATPFVGRRKSGDSIPISSNTSALATLVLCTREGKNDKNHPCRLVTSL